MLTANKPSTETEWEKSIDDLPPSVLHVNPSTDITVRKISGLTGSFNEKHEKEKLAEQVRRLLMYVGQAGTERDLEEWVRGLDDDKLVAFAEKYRDNLPFEVLTFLDDVKQRVNGQMPVLPKDSDIFMSDWIKNYREVHGLKKEDIVSQGREAVMEVLAIAFKRNGALTESERTTVRNMAQNITDETIIQRVMEYAVGHSYVVMCLLRNPNFDLNHTLQLVEKVAESYKKGEHADECKNILVEVSGHVASALDKIVMAHNKSGNEDIGQTLEFVPRIAKALEQVNGANLFSQQINDALRVLKDPNALQMYAKKLTRLYASIPVDNQTNGDKGKNGNGNSEKIRAKNAEKAATDNSEKNGGIFQPGSKRVPPSPKNAKPDKKSAEAKTPVQSGGSNKAKKVARVAAAQAKAASKRKRKNNGD